MIANRYHWTLEYILWGTSWANIQLMLADALRTDYKAGNKGESPASDVLDLSTPNPHAIEQLKRMAQR